MPSFLVIAGVVLLLIAAVVQLMGRRRTSALLLCILPGYAVILALIDVAKGPIKLGGSYESDQIELLVLAALLALTLAAVWLSRHRWLFWLAWVANAVVCGALVYLAFIWHPFG